MNIRRNRIAFIIGALSGLILIKQQPDGNLLVTAVFTLITGTLTLLVWLLISWLFKTMRK